MQTRIAASFHYSAAVRVLQLERAAKGQRPSQGGASLSPSSSAPAQHNWGFSLGSMWTDGGSQGRWFSYRVMKALEVWRL